MLEVIDWLERAAQSASRAPIHTVVVRSLLAPRPIFSQTDNNVVPINTTSNKHQRAVATFSRYADACSAKPDRPYPTLLNRE